MNRPTILLVEDDADSRGTLAAILLAEGYDVLTAGDGREALEMLARERPALIVLDLIMPGMDGWQFLQRLNRDDDFAMIPVVVASAADREPAGVAGFFAKPLDVSGLLKTVRDTLEKRAA